MSSHKMEVIMKYSMSLNTAQVCNTCKSPRWTSSTFSLSCYNFYEQQL